MLAYIHTHTRCCRRESDDNKHTHTHTPMPTLDLTCVQTHAHTSRGASFIALPGALLLRTHTSSCVLEICLMMTHPCPRLMTCPNTYFSVTFTGAFPLHACGVTHHWRTYFTSVRRGFLVETVVLQTVLWDIQAWIASFLVLLFQPICAVFIVACC